MQTSWVVVCLFAGVCGDIGGCVVGPDGSDTCDATTLLQQRNLKVVGLEQRHEESVGCGSGKKECPVPCEMGDWEEWSKCSKTCGPGTRTRTREVVVEAQHNGTCYDKEMSEECKEDECSEDCVVGDWSEWSKCSATCGDGTKTRSRKVTTEAKHGGQCYPLEDSEDCTNGGCPTPCEMCDWEDWGPCSETSGEGTHTRKREVSVNATNGGEPCGDLNETAACCITDCPQEINSLDFEVCGRVKSAEDDSDIAGAKVKILDKEATSNATGGFCIQKVPQGEATLSATKDGWVDTTMQLAAITQDTQDILVYMSKKLGSPKDWRIILTWGKTPLDLDARTQFGNDNTGCAVSYDKRSATCAKNDIEGKLDLDHCFYAEDGKHSCKKHASAPGGPSHDSKPETTTLVKVDKDTCGDDCKIHFHVSNYMSCLAWDNCPDGTPTKDTGTLKDSQAEVRVIHGDEQVAFFKLAEGDGAIKYGPDAPWGTSGSWKDFTYKQGYEEWWVFTIDVTTSKVLNCKTEECFSY